MLPKKIELDSLMEVVTDDEWNGLIGVLDSFGDNDLDSRNEIDGSLGVFLFFPLSVSQQQKHDLVGVNFFTSSVIFALKQNHSIIFFPWSKVEEYEQ